MIFFSYFCSKHRLWYSLEPPHRGSSNEYPQSIFLSRNNKNNVYPCKPRFYYIKVGYKGSKLYRYVFVMYTLKIKHFHWKKKKKTPYPQLCLRMHDSLIIMLFIVMLFGIQHLSYCLFVLRFYGPVNPMGSCWARSVYLTTRILGRLSPLSG